MTTKARVLAPGSAALTTTSAQLLGPVPTGKEWSVLLRAVNSGTLDAYAGVTLNSASGPPMATNTRVPVSTVLDIVRGLKLPAGVTVWGVKGTDGTLTASWTVMERDAPTT